VTVRRSARQNHRAYTEIRADRFPAAWPQPAPRRSPVGGSGCTPHQPSSNTLGAARPPLRDLQSQSQRRDLVVIQTARNRQHGCAKVSASDDASADYSGSSPSATTGTGRGTITARATRPNHEVHASSGPILPLLPALPRRADALLVPQSPWGSTSSEVSTRRPGQQGPTEESCGSSNGKRVRHVPSLRQRR